MPRMTTPSGDAEGVFRFTMSWHLTDVLFECIHGPTASTPAVPHALAREWPCAFGGHRASMLRTGSSARSGTPEYQLPLFLFLTSPSDAPLPPARPAAIAPGHAPERPRSRYRCRRRCQCHRAEGEATPDSRT